MDNLSEFGRKQAVLEAEYYASTGQEIRIYNDPSFVWGAEPDYDDYYHIETWERDGCNILREEMATYSGNSYSRYIRVSR